MVDKANKTIGCSFGPVGREVSQVGPEILTWPQSFPFLGFALYLVTQVAS